MWTGPVSPRACGRGAGRPRRRSASPATTGIRPLPWRFGPPARGTAGARDTAERSLLVLELTHDDAGVVPAEAERVRDADGDVGLPRLVRDVVEVALGILLLVVDRRRQHPAIDGKNREDGFHGTGGAEAVPGRALRRGDADVRRVLLAQRLLDYLGLARIAERRRGRVRVHVADLAGIDAAVRERHPHRPRRVLARRVGLGHVSRVG